MTDFHRFTRFDGRLGLVHDVRAAIHYQEAGGENSLTLTTTTPLAKGERLLWNDEGTWREHEVSDPKDKRDDGKPLCEAYCQDAMCELFRDKVDEKRIRGGTSSQAIGAVLEQTRWKIGTVNVTGTRTISFYHCSVGEALLAVAKEWGGELYSSYKVDDHGVVERYVNFVPAMGQRSTHKRFEYGKDLLSIERYVSPDDVYTAMRGYGKGEAVGDEAWGRRLTFESINGGKDYIVDAAALEKWGRPDGSGKAHSFGAVIFEDVEDKAELKSRTIQHLKENKEPKISYECTVSDLKAAGYTYEGSGVGDDVAIVDTSFTPALRLAGRVIAKERNVVDKSDIKNTLGNIRKHIGGETARLAAEIAGIKRRSSNWDVAANTPSAYINQIIDGLNKQFDAGMSFVYQSPEQGIIIGSVPLDPASGKPTRTPASAIQLKGGGFRIANAVNADGSFKWRTFGTGDGFVADELIAGVIRGGASEWNLETGELKIVNGTISISDAKDRTLSINSDEALSLADKAGNVLLGTSTAFGETVFISRATGSADCFLTTDWKDRNSNVWAGLTMMRFGTNRFGVVPTAKNGTAAGIGMTANGEYWARVVPRGAGDAAGVIFTSPQNQMPTPSLYWAERGSVAIVDDNVYLTGNVYINGTKY